MESRCRPRILSRTRAAPSRSLVCQAPELTISVRSGKLFDIDQGMQLAALHLLCGVVTHCILFTPARGSPFSAAFSDWLQSIIRSSRAGLAADALSAAPCAALPKRAPMRRRAGTGGRYCRPSSAEETGRAAGTAKDSRCAGDRRSRSSPRACRSCEASTTGLRRPESARQTLPLRVGQIAGKRPFPTVRRSLLCAWVHIPESKPPSHLRCAVNHAARITASSFLGQALRRQTGIGQNRYRKAYQAAELTAALDRLQFHTLFDSVRGFAAYLEI